ncbi:hypothetical protein F5I97DRAFT_1991629 [Phlebopus sp. FC_14]|nr:hypothetical protein F5I97DRAFT_1991629 [Phlebopus sp. FC_14]
MSAQSPPPLVFVSDPWDDEQHKVLDAAIHGAIHPLVSMSRDNPVAILPAIILLITNGDERRMKPPERTVLSQHSEQLFALLDEAVNLEQPTYRELRKLQILRVPEEKAKTTVATLQDPNQRQALQKAFEHPYRGGAVDGFYEYLIRNNKLFSAQGTTYYAKFCSIVQSSGTGKSRLMTELRCKDALVLYMNLRDRTDKSFPPRDDFPARVLTENVAVAADAYAARCASFWIALFRTLKEDLLEMLSQNNNNAAEAIRTWNAKMCDMRSQGRGAFFTKMEAFFKQIRLDDEAASAVEETADRMRDLALDGSSKKDEKLPPGTKELQDSYDDLIKSLPDIFPEDESKIHLPKLLVALDEAHRLHGMDLECAAIVCRTISLYSRHPLHKKDSVWVVFGSTTSKAAHFAAPRHEHPSLRVYEGGELLFTPYTDLGWDLFADSLSDIRATEAAKFKYIVHFGRPLWTSLKDVLDVSNMMELAAIKLKGANNDLKPSSECLALLAQRFGLHVTFGHPKSVAYVESGVASHMRICISVTPDRTWMYTCYPSEPLLSCAAAEELHRPKVLDASLKFLQEKVNEGMIEKGGRGELASRLLWLLGKDLYVRSKLPSAQAFLRRDDRTYTWETAELKDCRMIPVADFLEFVFGEGVWTGAEGAKKLFANAHLNFSHWVSMDGQIGCSPSYDMDTSEWTLRHLCRSSAVQCCHTQPLVDKVIPIYFDGAGKLEGPSHIYISDKAKESSNQSLLSSITPRALGINDMALPYIAILLDMGRPKSEFTVTFTEPNPVLRNPGGPEAKPLRIYAAGMYADTFPFLKAEKARTVLDTLADLVRPEPLVDKPSSASLRNQVLYGSTRDAHHMKWELNVSSDPNTR